MILIDSPDQFFPVREEHLKNLQERLQRGEESISRLKVVSEEEIKIWVIQELDHKVLWEEYLNHSTPKVEEIKSQLSKHEVAVCVLEPAEYKVISEQAQVWGVFIKIQTGPI